MPSIQEHYSAIAFVASYILNVLGKPIANDFHMTL